MSELDNNFFDYNFFIIDSNNLKDITSRLYGYVIIDDKFYINGTIKEIPRYADGAYVNISKDNGSIRIQQDCNGSCGLSNESYVALVLWIILGFVFYLNKSIKKITIER